MGVMADELVNDAPAFEQRAEMTKGRTPYSPGDGNMLAPGKANGLRSRYHSDNGSQLLFKSNDYMRSPGESGQPNTQQILRLRV